MKNLNYEERQVKQMKNNNCVDNIDQVSNYCDEEEFEEFISQLLQNIFIIF